MTNHSDLFPAAAGLSVLAETTYTANGAHTWHPDTKWIYGVVVGSGASAGSGAVRTSGTVTGGSAASGGQVVSFLLPRALFGSVSNAITVGAAVAGGAAVTGTGSNVTGNDGLDGNYSAIGDVVRALGGLKGIGGTSSNRAGGLSRAPTHPEPLNNTDHPFGKGGDSHTITPEAGQSGLRNRVAPGGGGGGAGDSSGGLNGATGGPRLPGETGAAVTVADGDGGVAGNAKLGIPGGSGAGGRGKNNSDAGAGGDGAVPGGAGGGGGAVYWSSGTRSSGKGGDSARGEIYILELG